MALMFQMRGAARRRLWALRERSTPSRGAHSVTFLLKQQLERIRFSPFTESTSGISVNYLIIYHQE